MAANYCNMAAPGVRLSAVVSHEVPSMALLDPLRTRQILANGITNALKFTKQGSVRIQVRQWWVGGGVWGVGRRLKWCPLRD